MGEGGSLQARNLDRGTLLAERVERAERWGARLRGLLGRDGLAEGEGLFIRPCTSIHSCFMRFVFDAVFLGKDGRVCHLISRMRPWRFSRLVLDAEGVLELPAGVIEKSGTRLGDRVELAP
ncbi:MAG: DUF192 domain-containing protein [Myxococcales bacterium]|nr:DUF192 domain-containing protein [Myxococcales bacterium]